MVKPAVGGSFPSGGGADVGVGVGTGVGVGAGVAVGVAGGVGVGAGSGVLTNENERMSWAWERLPVAAVNPTQAFPSSRLSSVPRSTSAVKTGSGAVSR
jgi:hypothetical protein